MAVVALVAALDLACAYVAFDRGNAEIVLGGVLGIEMLALCIFRPRPALVVFTAIWGVVHVLLSNGEVEGSGGTGASISKLVGVTVVIGFGIAVARLHAKRDPHPLPFPLKAFIVFAGLYGLAEVITPFHSAGLSDLVKVVGGLVLALVAYYVIDREDRLLRLALAAGIAGTAVAGVALAQSIFGIEIGDVASYPGSSGVFRATSLTGSANGTADFLLVCAGFMLARYTLRRERSRARIDLAILCIVSFGVVVTFTRADILALLAMFAIWACIWQLRSVSAFALRARLLIVLAAVALAVLQLVGTTALASRLEGRLTLTSKAHLLNGREEIWSGELHKLESASLNTILIGNGAHTSYTSVYVPQAEKYHEFAPHDLFLWLLIETGVIGLLVYTSALLGLCREFLRAARSSRFTPTGRVAAVAFATTIAFTLDSMFHNTQVSSGSYWYFMLFVGAALSVIRARTSTASER
jgi:O-antigen ligase